MSSSKDVQFSTRSRPRRNRKNATVRALCLENTLSAHDLVYPLFIHRGSKDEDIQAMPGQKRHSPDGLISQVAHAKEQGVNAVVLFPRIEDSLKTSDAVECYNESGLYPQSIERLKSEFPDLVVITDVALDPYSSDGHDGLVSAEGEILNDPTIELLCKQAVCQANAGADIISPSDMMDGRVGAIRQALDQAGHNNVSILSYTAKYASAFYGPFRGALDSAPRSGDKKTYQMNPANARESLRELALDELEGADMLMVKPAGAYLDIIRRFREETNLPISAYQVSGEYLMIKAASATGWLDEKAVALESLLAIKRAGADMIFSYFAPQVQTWLNEK